jgi:phosphoenolpyruvate carboxylase
MVNLAEELHRERRRREHLFAGDPPMRGWLETLPADAGSLLERLEIRLVFTAHPTEVSRRTTLEKLLTIAALLREGDQRRLTGEEAAAIDDELRAQIVLMWQSNELYATAPTVADEVRNLLARFRESIFDEATNGWKRALAPTCRRFSASAVGSDPTATGTPTSHPMRSSTRTSAAARSC